MNEVQTKKRATFTDWLRAQAAVITAPIAKFLSKLGIHPNTVTLLGFLLVSGAAVVLATGNLRLGGALLLITSTADAIDGTLARLKGTKGHFGAFLDSTVDRVSDAVLLFGLLVHLLPQGGAIDVYLIFASMLGFVMVSYTRARAEGVGYTCKVGILTRVERILLLGGGMLLNLPRLTLVALAVLSWVTVLQRVLFVYKQAREEM